MHETVRLHGRQAGGGRGKAAGGPAAGSKGDHKGLRVGEWRSRESIRRADSVLCQHCPVGSVYREIACPTRFDFPTSTISGSPIVLAHPVALFLRLSPHSSHATLSLLLDPRSAASVDPFLSPRAQSTTYRVVHGHAHAATALLMPRKLIQRRYHSPSSACRPSASA